MRVSSLKLANLRSIETAEFGFQPGFNLIVGENGVGKTSMLNALCVCLSAFVKQANGLSAPVEAFTVEDIRAGTEALTVECSVQIESARHSYLIHKPRETSVPQAKKAGSPREQMHDTPEKATFLGPPPMLVSGTEPGGRPLAVLFSTNRAVPSERAPGKRVAAGGLCCYCMIEHFRSRSSHPGEQLNYRNLLGACLGEYGKPSHLQHCDTRKGNRELEWNPAEPAHHIETRVRYEPDGSIHAYDAGFDAQLNDVLNLNLPVLKNNRRGVLDAVLQWWRSEKARIGAPVPRDRLVRERDKRIAGNGELEPYCQIAVWWLGQKLARIAA